MDGGRRSNDSVSITGITPPVSYDVQIVSCN